MEYAHNTVLILPILSVDQQKEIVELSFSHETLANGKIGRISLMGIPTSIAGITCTLPEPGKAADGGPQWTAIESAWINRATNHMLSIIQMGHDKNADYFRLEDHGIFSFSRFSEDEKPIFGMQTELIGEPAHIDAQVLSTSYSVTSERNLHHIMELLSESVAWRIPSHYRFLALYKIIELEHPRRTADFHGSMDQEYATTSGDLRPLRNLLPQIRVKVAHAVASGVATPGLTDADRNAVAKLIPIMQRAIQADIAERYGMRFTVTPGDRL